jgi:hypothetical protein
LGVDGGYTQRDRSERSKNYSSEAIAHLESLVDLCLTSR